MGATRWWQGEPGGERESTKAEKEVQSLAYDAAWRVLHSYVQARGWTAPTATRATPAAA